jgi:hypothetical protein
LTAVHDFVKTVKGWRLTETPYKRRPTEGGSNVNEERQNDGVQKSRRIKVHIVGAVVLAAILVSFFVGGPPGIIFYLGGLFNSMGIQFIGLLLFASPVILFVEYPGVTAFCLVTLLASIVYFWRKLGLGWRWTCVLLIVFCVAFPASLALRIGPSGAMMRVWGFYWYAQIKTDVPAIQAWLGTLDPNDCRDQSLDEKIAPTAWMKDPPKFIPWPSCLMVLHSKNVYTRLLKDNAGQPMIRLSWGSGMAGTWGVVVGNKGMEIPKTEDPRWKEYQSGSKTDRLWEHGEYRKALAPGAYVWTDLE